MLFSEETRLSSARVANKAQVRLCFTLQMLHGVLQREGKGVFLPRVRQDRTDQTTVPW